MIPLSVPHIAGNEWAYVKECLDTGWVSSVGAFVDRFEREFAGKIGCKYAVATTNGTAALHTALLVAGVQAEDEVLVSTFTFIAPANAVRYCGAWPVFVDAEPGYWQIDPQRVVDFLHQDCTWKSGALYNSATGRRVRAIVAVDLYGHPVDMDPISEVARKFDLAVIEDASEALGARYKGRAVGTLGDLACFSFNGNKIITTGGGGMITTDNATYAERARYLTTQAKDDPIEYVHDQIGYNYRLTNIQAALGVAQLEQLDENVEHKQTTIRRYREALAGARGMSVYQGAEWAKCTYWLSNILVDEITAGADSRDLMRWLRSKDIETRPLWRPMHLQAPYRDAYRLGGANSEKLYAKGLSLPSSVGLRAEEIDAVGIAVNDWGTKGIREHGPLAVRPTDMR